MELNEDQRLSLLALEEAYLILQFELRDKTKEGVITSEDASDQQTDVWKQFLLGSCRIKHCPFEAKNIILTEFKSVKKCYANVRRSYYNNEITREDQINVFVNKLLSWQSYLFDNEIITSKEENEDLFMELAYNLIDKEIEYFGEVPVELNIEQDVQICNQQTPIGDLFVESYIENHLNK